MPNERVPGHALETPRIRRFREKLVSRIPRFPNNKASLEHMQSKELPEIVIDYIAWRSRYLGARPREVVVEPTASADPKWAEMSSAIEIFMDKVRRGEDLSPHLSIDPHNHGYTPIAHAQGATIEQKWLDKDFVLNTTGLHHFHLGVRFEERGHIERTNDVLFAEVTREKFTAIAIFDHDVFVLGSEEQARMSEIHMAVRFRNVPPGTTAMVGGGITLAGTTVQGIFYAQRCLRILMAQDAKLDDQDYVRRLYSQAVEPPKRPKPEWDFVHLDLAIYDEIIPAHFIVQAGWN